MESQFELGAIGRRGPDGSESQPPASPPTARRRETQQRLLEAAAAVFSELGLQGASVEAICARAGFSRGAFYSNFSGKEQLFLTLLSQEFERRAKDIAERSVELEPMLLAHSGNISPEAAAKYIAEFFSPSQGSASWHVLEVEFLLLAMRDPSIAPGHLQFIEEFNRSIVGVVERVLLAAGRRFSLPVERAIPVLNSVYEGVLRATIMNGPSASGGIDELGERLAELLFAITEPVQAGGD